MEQPEIPLNALNPGSKNNLRGKKCSICSLSLKTREAIDERIKRGDKVLDVMRWAGRTFQAEGVDKFQHDVFYNHKKHHVLMIQRAASKLSDGQRMQHRQVKLAKAVLNDEIDPQAYFAPAAIAQDIAKTAQRLDTAADDALNDKQHASLASLSSALIRSHELRAKLGGNLRENPEINLNVSIGDLHARLDNLLSSPADDRQNAARALLGLAPPTAAPVIPEPIVDANEAHTIEIERNPDDPPS